jgi:hypothetical protein
VVHFGGEPNTRYDEGRLLNYHRGLLTFFRKHRPLLDGLGLRIVLALRSLSRMAVWGMVALSKPGERAEALSCFRGYRRSFGLLLGEKLL